MTTVLTTEDQIQRFRWAQRHAAVRLEKLGMRHSSGRSVTAVAKRELGLKRSATYDEVINAINDKLK